MKGQIEALLDDAVASTAFASFEDRGAERYVTTGELKAFIRCASLGELEYLKGVMRQRILEIGEERDANQIEEVEFYLDVMEDIDERLSGNST